MRDLVRLAVLGAGGRMGRVILALAVGDARFEIVSAHAPAGSEALGQDAGLLAGKSGCGITVSDDLVGAIAVADVVVDFTRPEFTVAVATECAANGTRLVSGTTGLDDAQHARLRDAAARTAILWAPNMSVGVNLLLSAVAHVAGCVGEDYDAEIVETHHRHKVDAPSGTAVALGEAIAAVRGRPLSELVDHDRQARRESRQPGRIGMHSLRAGEIVGEHDVRLITAGEEIRLGHTAFSRDAFASGALRAAAWVNDRDPGLYGMHDVLEIPRVRG